MESTGLRDRPKKDQSTYCSLGISYEGWLETRPYKIGDRGAGIGDKGAGEVAQWSRDPSSQLSATLVLGIPASSSDLLRHQACM